MPNLLITSAGRRVSLLKAFQKEIRHHFPQGRVFACDANPAQSAACQIADDWFAVPRLDNKQYIETLLQRCRSMGITVVVPTIDTELLVLAQHRLEALSHGIHFVVSDPALITTCQDKRLTNQFFRDVGFKTPEIYPHDKPQFPLFVKPFDGSAGIDNFYVPTEEHLSPYMIRNARLMFCQYLPKEEFTEYTVDCYFDRQSNLQCVVPRQRLEIRAGEVSKSLTKRNHLVPLLEDQLGTIGGARGCITLQVFVHNERADVYGIEINPRFGGGYPLSYQAGANFPRYLIEEYLCAKELSSQESWQEDTLMLRYDHEVFVDDPRT